MDRLAAELVRIADELSGSVLNKTGQKRFARLQKLVDKKNPTASSPPLGGVIGRTKI